MNPTLREVDQNIKDLSLRIENLIEAAAAKIITDISDKIDKCECIKELLEQTNNQLTLGKGKEIEPLGNNPSRLQKYSYPNYMVGNESLGSSKDPHSLIWPFGLDKPN